MGKTLKPCPFCGGEAKPDFFQSSYRIACLTPQCPASEGYLFDFEDQAIEAWNRRSQPQEEEPVLWITEDELERILKGRKRGFKSNTAVVHDGDGWMSIDAPPRIPLYRHRNPISEG